MTKLQTSKMDLLNGSLWDKILIFALPLAATGILQQLFNAADVAIVGQFASKEAMGAVGSNAPVIALFVQTFLGFSVGANVVISRFTGQKNSDGISRGVHTSVTFALICGVVVAVLAELAAPAILNAMGVPDNIYSMALSYLRIYLAGLPVIFLYNFESAIFMSQGDTRTPLICLVISGITNVLLNLFFVIIVGMTASGVALATVIANALSSGMLFVILMRKKNDTHLSLSGLRIDGGVLKIMIKIGLPAGIQSMVFSLSNICVQSAVNSLGSDVIAASAAAFNIEVLCYYLLNSFGQACTTFIGQNHGAGNLVRCRQVTRTGFLLDSVITVAFSIVLLLSGTTLLGLFNSDPVICEVGVIRLKYILYFEMFNVIMEIMSGSLRGYGKSTPPAIISLVMVCGSRILWIFTAFKAAPSLDRLMVAYPLSWGLSAVALTVTYFVYVRKLNKRIPKARSSAEKA